MSRSIRVGLGWASFLSAFLALQSVAVAQSINLKTIPLAVGDQFRLFPSRTLAMGGVSIALDDRLGDPLVNPAKGARLSGATLLSSPTYYGISDGGGASLTLPVGMLVGTKRWFAGGAVALQQLRAGEQVTGPRPYPLHRVQRIFPNWTPRRDTVNSNTLVFGLAGVTVPGTRLSVAGSALLADLGAVDGIDRLYPGNLNIRQSGTLADVRAGLLLDWEGGRSLEAVGIHSRLSITHDVYYFDETNTWLLLEPTLRIEANVDRTTTWGLHLGYQHPLGAHWKFGTILTGNWKSHPELPGYTYQGRVRDPGTSHAYDVGFGVSRDKHPLTMAFELVLEPARSHTWGIADEAFRTRRGTVVGAGGMTVDNRFSFSNFQVRAGGAYQPGPWEILLGIELRGVRYHLEQEDFVTASHIAFTGSWNEVTPTWGLAYQSGGVVLRYTGRRTAITGASGERLGVVNLTQGSGPDFLIVTNGFASSNNRVVTHQLLVSVRGW